MGKNFMWTFVGFCLGLIVVELTDNKPAKKINYYTNDQYMVRYIYRPFPSHYYHYTMQPDTFNNQRPQRQASNGNGESRVKTHTNTFNHTAQERQESWGTKN
tara:strand:+ start:14248 stop:14553 length:306 start_codon:yes stop_codon:yes gene_type:complete